MCVSNPDNKGRAVPTWSCGPATSRCGRRSWLSRPPAAVIGAGPGAGGGDRFSCRRRPRRAHWHVGCIPNASSTDAYALYSVANGRFVEGAAPT